MSFLKQNLRARVGLAASAAVVVGLATAGSAAASSSPGSAPADRTPSTPSAVVANNTLLITGTSAADRVDLFQLNNDTTTLDVEFNSDGHVLSFDRATFTAISAALGSGDDTFFEDPSTVRDETLTVDAGSGNDTIHTGAGNDTVFGGSGNDFIRAGAGSDLIFAGSGTDDVDGEKGNDTAFLEGGNDTFTWNPGEGSDAVDGGSGVDTLQFNGAGIDENMSLSANGHNAVFLRDVANIRMDLSDVETVNVKALGGKDNLTVNDMSGTDVRTANLDLSGSAGTPDQQADVVTVSGTPQADHIKIDASDTTLDVRGLQTETTISGSDPQFDHLQVNGQGGNDKATVRGNLSGLIDLGLNLGA